MKEPLFCVYVCTVRAKHVKTYPENAESRIFDGPLSDQPDRTRDDAGKKLGQCARRRISANFSSPRDRFPSIPSIFGESTNMAS